MGIEEILEAVVERVPPPPDRSMNAPRALIFDSFYDQYLGIVCQFRVMDGVFTKQDTVQFMNTGRAHAVTDLWIRAPDRVDVASLSAGEVGCLAGAMKTVQVWLHSLLITRLLRVTVRGTVFLFWVQRAA